MLHYATLHRIERFSVLILWVVFILGVGQTPAQAEKIVRPSQQAGCDYSSSTGPGWYVQILTQVFYPPSGNWDIYRTDPCFPYDDRVQLTTTPGFDGYPRFNADATRIVFVSERNGNPEIYLMNADGSGQTRLTSSLAMDTAPAFSPDGTKIAFVSERDGNPEIYLMNPDGSDQVRLTANMLQDYDPVWSPDGSQIAWVQGSDTARQVYTMSAAGGSPAPLSAPLKNARRPVWSPLADRLVLEADDNDDGWQDLIEISSDGTGLRVLPISKTVTASYGEDFLMGGWWLDGSAIVFTRAAYNVNGGTRALKSATLEHSNSTGYINRVDSSDNPSFFPSVGSLDPYPPVVVLQPLPQYSRAGVQTLNWMITDTGASGLDCYRLETRVLPDGQWSDPGYPWCEDISTSDPHSWSGSARIQDPVGYTVAYRIRAWDRAGNEAVSASISETTLFGYVMAGSVTDTRGYPLPAVQIQAGDGVVNTPQTDAQGLASLYFKSGGPVQATFTAPGYGGYPSQTWPLRADGNFRAALPPLQNLLANGDFESPVSALSDWQPSGNLLAQPGDGLTGNRAARLGEQCDNHLCLGPFEKVAEKYITSSSLVISSDGITHVLVVRPGAYSEISSVYFTRSREGIWSTGQILPHVTSPSRLMISGDDTLYFTYVNDANLAESLAYKPRGGDWVFETIPNLNTSTFGYAFTVDAQNNFHLVYQHTQGGIRYIRRQADGTWTGPFLVPLDPHNNNLSILLGAVPDGALHLVYQETPRGSSYPLQPWYARMGPDGSLAAVQKLPSFYPGIGYWDEYVLESLVVSANGDTHVLATDLYDSKAVYWKRAADGTWSDPNVVGGDWEQEFEMVAGPTGDAAIFAEQYYENSVFFYYRPAGEAQFTYWVADLGRRYRRLTPALDELGQLQILLVDFGNGSGDLFYSRLVPPALPGQAAIQQTVTIPADLPNPTLSFRYKVEQEFPGLGSKMEVSVTPSGESPMAVFTSQAQRGSWLHGWADLSAYAGQTVTVTFRLNQADGEWYARLLLDEVSLGAWTTPVIQAFSPEVIPPPEANLTPLRLHGLNLSGGGQVFIGERPSEKVTLDHVSGDLLITLPADLPPGAYPIRLIDPDGREALAPHRLSLGYLSYFPFLSR